MPHLTRNAHVHLTRLRGEAVAFDAARRELFILSDDAADLWERLDSQTEDVGHLSQPEVWTHERDAGDGDPSTRVLAELLDAGLAINWRDQDRQT